MYLRSKWIKKTRHHTCSMPNAKKKNIGSLWRCRCGQIWRLKNVIHSPMNATKQATWERYAVGRPS